MRLYNKRQQVIALKSGAIVANVFNVGLSKRNGITGKILLGRETVKVKHFKHTVWMLETGK